MLLPCVTADPGPQDQILLDVTATSGGRFNKNCKEISANGGCLIHVFIATKMSAFYRAAVCK